MSYRVEYKKGKGSHFRIDCPDDKLQDAIKLINEIRESEGSNGEAYYRKFPVTKNKKNKF